MKVVYLAHPYRGAGEWQIRANIDRAATVARDLWKLGLAVLSPVTNSAFMSGPDIPEEVFLRGGLELLSRCDAIVMGPGWRESEGCRAEKRRAEDLGMPVFDLDELQVGAGRERFRRWAEEGLP